MPLLLARAGFSFCFKKLIKPSLGPLPAGVVDLVGVVEVAGAAGEGETVVNGVPSPEVQGSPEPVITGAPDPLVT